MRWREGDILVDASVEGDDLVQFGILGDARLQGQILTHSFISRDGDLLGLHVDGALAEGKNVHDDVVVHTIEQKE